MCTIGVVGVRTLIIWILILWSNLTLLITLYSCKKNVTLKMAGLLTEISRWKYNNIIAVELSAFCRFLTLYINLPETLFLRSTTTLHFILKLIHLYSLFYTTNFIMHIKQNCTLSDWVRCDAVGWATALQEGRLQLRFPMGSLALGVDWDSDGNGYQVCLQRLKAAGA